MTFSFPDHGSDGGGLDLGIVHVGEEKKCTCALKNRGKYEVGFKYVYIFYTNSFITEYEN